MAVFAKFACGPDGQLIVKEIDTGPSKARIKSAQRTVDKALAGKLPFAYKRIRPTITSRTKEWQAHDWFPTEHTIRTRTNTFNRIKHALQVLQKGRIIDFYHISPHGRMKVIYSANGEVVNFNDLKGTNIQTSLRGKTPEYELLKRKEGKLRYIHPETYAEKTKYEAEKQKMRQKTADMWYKSYGAGLDVAPTTDLKNPKYTLPLIPDNGIPVIKSLDVNIMRGHPTYLWTKEEFDRAVMLSNERLYEITHRSQMLYYQWREEVIARRKIIGKRVRRSWHNYYKPIRVKSLEGASWSMTQD